MSSDIKTFVIPEISFGVLGALAGPSLTGNHAPEMQAIISRIPQVFLWTWLNTLVFDLANQRLPDSVREDSINKVWRPLPAGRIGAPATRRLLLGSIVIAFFTSLYLGAAEETMLLMSLNWMYNDLGGADESYIVRNLIISVAYACYGSGALRIASADESFARNSMWCRWTALTSAIIFTSMQVQDLKDQDGDSVRQRKTVPLVLGDRTARLTVAAPVIIWSFVCPAFWALEAHGYVVPLVLGITVATRVSLARNKEADTLTWKIWGLWLMSLYSLPLVSSMTRKR